MKLFRTKIKFTGDWEKDIVLSEHDLQIMQDNNIPLKVKSPQGNKIGFSVDMLKFEPYPYSEEQSNETN